MALETGRKLPQRKQGKMADARRLRTIWVESIRLQPELPEERRYAVVVKEFVKRTPAGGFMYLNSFHSTVPSEAWMKNVLRGRWQGEVLGEPLLSMPERANKGTGLVSRVARLENLVLALMDSLGVKEDS